MAAPTMSECAVLVAAVGAGAAVAACAGYIANAWANLANQHHGHKRLIVDSALPVVSAGSRSVELLLNTKVDSL
ncbi:hypothetical protein [Kutzneria buriramensis]|uniref:hypothetical protein n=1 Tax=Kutzneria buriramensis TaxID=1045776 RepID=UPI0011C19A81|nr:hypothetical protein [Kutzneria buriramensis]